LKHVFLALILAAASLPAAAQSVNLSDVTPAAPSGAMNLHWQHDSSTPSNTSAYVSLQQILGSLQTYSGCNTPGQFLIPQAEDCRGIAPSDITNALQSSPVGIQYGGTAASSAQQALQNLMGAPAFYATNYGAMFNTKKLIDVTTSANTGLVSSASYQFTSADVGKLVTIRAGTAISLTGSVTLGSYYVSSLTGATGANFPMSLIGAGIPPGTILKSWDFSGRLIMSQLPTATATGESIQAVDSINTSILSVSNGQATLAANALTSISGQAVMWFGTDDTAALNAVETAAYNAGGGTVVIPAGLAMVSNYIDPLTGVGFRGIGKNVSGIKYASAASMGVPPSVPAMFYTPGSSPGSSLNDAVFADFEIDMDDAKETTLSADASCFLIPWSKRLTFLNMNMHGSPASCIRNDFAQDMLVYGDNFSHTGRLSDGTGNGGNAIGETYAENVVFRTTVTAAFNTFYDCGVTCILAQGSGTNTHTDTLIAVGNLAWWDGFSPNINPSTGVISCIDEEGGYYSVIAANICKAQEATSTAANTYGIGNGKGDGNNGGTPSVGTLFTGNAAAGFGNPFLISNPGTTGTRMVSNTGANGGYSSGFRVDSPSSTSPDSDLEFSDNKALNNYGPGFLINTSSAAGVSINGLRIKGNSAVDNGTGGSGQGAYKQSGFAFIGSAGNPIQGLEMTGNTSLDDGPGTQLYSVGLAINTQLGTSSSSPAVVKNNNLAGVAMAPFFQTDPNTSKIIGLNEDNGPFVYTIPSSATPVISFTFGEHQNLTLTAATSPTLSGLVASQHLFLHICQDGTGGHALTLPAAFVLPPAMPQGAGLCMNQEFISTDGSTLSPFPQVGSGGTVTGGDGILDSSTGTVGTLSPLTQSANTVLAGSSSGSAAIPSFRALAVADLPATTPNLSTAETVTGYPWVYDGDSTSAPDTLQFTTSTNSGGTGGITAGYACSIFHTLQTGSQYYAEAWCLDTTGDMKLYQSGFHSLGNEAFGLVETITPAGVVTLTNSTTATQYDTTVTTVSASATPALSAKNGLQIITLNANATPTISNVVAGQFIAIRICAAGFTWAWPATMVSAPAVPSSGCNTYPFYSFDGTNLTYVGPPPSTAGLQVLTAGTATVSTSAACTPSASCVYKLTRCLSNSSTAVGVPSISSVSAGTSFTITSLSSTNTTATGDLASICWQIN
jgi:hypothetical protein